MILEKIFLRNQENLSSRGEELQIKMTPKEETFVDRNPSDSEEEEEDDKEYTEEEINEIRSTIVSFLLPSIVHPE